LYSHKTQLNIKLSLLQHYNMFRPKLSAIFRLYMVDVSCECVVLGVCSMSLATGNHTHTPTPFPFLRATSVAPLFLKFTPKGFAIEISC